MLPEVAARRPRPGNGPVARHRLAAADASGHRSSLRSLDHQVVDTTAAGDAFCGALAAELARGVPVVDAVRFAAGAGAVAVGVAGAQPSLGDRAAVEAVLSR